MEHMTNRLTPKRAALLRLSDTYGHRVRPGKARHRLCVCNVPCQRTFMCRGLGVIG